MNSQLNYLEIQIKFLFLMSKIIHKNANQTLLHNNDMKNY